MSQDERYRESSPRRRRSPPYDVRRSADSGDSTGIQIRGLAKDRVEQGTRESDRDTFQDIRRQRDNHAGDRRDDGRASWRSWDYDDRDDYQRIPRRRSSVSRSPPRSPPRFERRYRDRDAPSHRSSPERNAAKASSSPRRRDRSPYYGAPPSREVILEGLPLDLIEDDIRSELKAYRVDNLEDVRIIKDRKTGLSRQFGFLRFSSVDEAKTFMEHNFPTIHLYGSRAIGGKGQATPVNIAFCRERVDREPVRGEGDWTCSNCMTLNYYFRNDCLRCKAARSEVALPVQAAGPTPQVNTGDSDVSPENTPSQYLLFRALEASVSEELLAKGATKLLKPEEAQTTANANPLEKGATTKIASTSTVAHAGARIGCIRRVLLIRDRKSNESCRYGFVEFAAVEDAQAALARFNAMDKFTIASKPVLVSYIHTGVFVPYLKPAASAFTFTASTNAALQLTYWDEGAYASVLVISTGNADRQSPEKGDAAKSTKDSAAATKKKRKADPNTGEPAKPKKQMASHLQFWTNRHAELHGIDTSPNTSKDATPTPEVPKAAKAVAAASPLIQTQSYASPTKHCCYLCSRQFKIPAEVNKHERLSELHRKNLSDASLVEKARARLQKEGVVLAPASTTAEEEAAADLYRDRARERRKAHNQPKQPGFKGQGTGRSSSSNTKDVTTTTASANSPSPPPPPTQDPPKNKGAALLAKMGHVPGAGLGAAGTGATAPIETNLYAAGVGLGAEGGKVGDAVVEAERRTRAGGDYGEFVRDVRERARERFARE